MGKPSKPQTRFGYMPESVALMKQAALHVRTVLGDLYQDVVIVGGLVPSLLMPNPPKGVPAPPGTMDLDLGLSLGLLDGERYTEVSDRLRKAGFAAAANKDGRQMRQTWEFKIDGGGRVLIDFLIGPVSAASVPGKLQNLEDDFAAFIAEGVPLAFRDKRTVTLSGKTLKGEEATRETLVCGPSAFVAMKAAAFKNRGEPKDAFDLFYVLNYYQPFEEIVTGFRGLLKGDGARCAVDAFETVKTDFKTAGTVGCMRAADFVLGEEKQGRDEFCADVSGVVTRFATATAK